MYPGDHCRRNGYCHGCGICHEGLGVKNHLLRIFARANGLEIRIELKQITPSVTRIEVKANKTFFNKDKTTAQEIVHQTSKIAEKLVS